MSHNFVNPVDIVDSTDTTKKVRIDPSGAATSTTATITTAQVANRTYSVPDSGASAAFVMTEGAQTLNGTKTFKTSLVVQETSGTDGITIQAPALASSYSLTLPVDAGTSDNQVLTTDGSGVLSWQSFLPAGMLLPFAGSSTPSGFLLCDGTAVSRTTYANLFAAISTLWGVGDGSTTFNLPNLSRRTLAGSGGASTGTLGNTTGSTGGAETHTLTSAELAAHTHSAGTLVNSAISLSGSTGNNSADHTHSGTTDSTTSNINIGAGGTGNKSLDVNYEPFAGAPSTDFGTAHTHSFTTGGVSANHTHGTGTLAASTPTISGSTGSEGSGAAHNIIQPTAIVTYVIKF